MLSTVQAAFGQTASALQLFVALPQPTTAGNTLSLYLRFSPLTGTPLISDNYGNLFVRSGVIDWTGAASGIWTAAIVRGGAGHTITVTSQGGVQALEMGVTELSCPAPMLAECGNSNEVLLAMYAQMSQQTSLLQRLVTAERA
jgi:hypothetical protein